MNEPDVRDPLLGLVVHDYVISQKLAEGGMGKVYLASHQRLPKQVVIKVLLGDYANHPVIRGRFEREALAAAKLRHRYVIDILNFGALPDGQLFLMMPLLEGRPLDAHLRQHHGKLNLYDTTHIILQVLVALQYMHDQGIVHRDLKPGNIFITRTELGWKVTLIDLGIVRDVAIEASSVKTDTGVSIGTPGYMAPEQYGDAANAGPSADLYAVAIMLWEMLLGERPWNAPNTNMMFHLQVTTVPQLPPGTEMPPELLTLTQKMLSKDPERRPQRAREVAIALASLVPAIPPHVPSGAEILKKVAPEFAMESSPYDGTLRNKGNVQYPTPAASSWTPQATQVPALSTGTPRSPFDTPTPNVAAAVPTVSHRPAAAFAALAPPVATPIAPAPFTPPVPRSDQWESNARRGSSITAAKTVAIGVVCALLVGVTTFLIASLRHKKIATTTPNDASLVAPSEPAVAPSRAIDAGTTVTSSSTVAQPDAGSAPGSDAAPVVPAKHAAPSNHATTTRHATERAQSNGASVGAGSASTVPPNTGSASTPTKPKNFDPDVIEE